MTQYHDHVVADGFWLSIPDLSMLEAPVPVRLDGPTILLPALQRLDELSRLAPDWDSFDALPPSAIAVDAAETLMRAATDQFEHLSGERAAPTTVLPTAAGGLQLEWQGSTAEVVLSIREDAALSYLLVEHPNEVRRFSEGTRLSNSDALALINRVIAH